MNRRVVTAVISVAAVAAGVFGINAATDRDTDVVFVIRDSGTQEELFRIIRDERDIKSVLFDGTKMTRITNDSIHDGDPWQSWHLWYAGSTRQIARMTVRINVYGDVEVHSITAYGREITFGPPRTFSQSPGETVMFVATHEQ